MSCFALEMLCPDFADQTKHLYIKILSSLRRELLCIMGGLNVVTRVFVVLSFLIQLLGVWCACRSPYVMCVQSNDDDEAIRTHKKHSAVQQISIEKLHNKRDDENGRGKARHTLLVVTNPPVMNCENSRYPQFFITRAQLR
jgi:hypothetical protein